jgi:hypothetical protein
VPQWGRPSRRGRRDTRTGDDEGWWGTGQRVHEVDSEDDGALARRLSGDTLRFGVDLDDRDGLIRSRKGYTYDDDDDDDSEETSDVSEEGSDDDEEPLPPLDPVEEMLADQAEARIRKAHAKGKMDVKLRKGELAAYQKRLEIIEQQKRQAKRMARKSGRVAISLDQLAPSGRSKKLMARDTPRGSEDDDEMESRPLPKRPLAQLPAPPARPRQRSGTGSRAPSRAASDRESSSSPFQYSYVRAEPGVLRQASDSAASRNGGSGHADPFQYMTNGSRSSSYNLPTRNSFHEADDAYVNYSSPAAANGIRGGDSSESPDDEVRASPGSQSRSTRQLPASESAKPSTEKTPERTKKVAPAPSAALALGLAKRKTVSNGTSTKSSSSSSSSTKKEKKGSK